MDREKPTNRAVGEILIPRLRVITIFPIPNSLRPAAFPITRKTKCKKDSLPSLTVIRYHFLLIRCPLRHLDEFIENFGGVHNVFWLVSVYILAGLSVLRSSKQYKLKDEMFNELVLKEL
ncbi:uncharacterized protein TNCV_2437901 [Trichonephila clavipes]|nr:uncharacterized protein TNCV_2437901 [Trichonephila clavipes]